MNSFVKILTGIFFCGIMILNTANADLIRCQSMSVKNINYDVNNNLIVEGIDSWGKGYDTIKIIIKDLNTKNFVSTYWNEYQRKLVLLKSNEHDQFISGKGFIPDTISLKLHPIEYEMGRYYYELDNESG